MNLNYWKILTLLFCLLPGALVAQMDMITLAKKNEPYLFEIRNHLHENPEICWQEDKSLFYIRKQLETIKPVEGRKIKFHEGFEGGLVVDLVTEPSKKYVLFRADIDALSVQEDPNHDVVSKVKGKMHACGHDVHSAMLLTALKILATDSNIKPTKNIRFIWQRAEENPGSDPKRYSGAYTFIKENVLENIDEVYGIHIWSRLPSGGVYSANRAIMGTANRLKIDINSSGGHSSAPHQGVNALRVANALMDALKEVHVRLLGPTESVSLEPTILNSGTATNAMPAHAQMWYTLRTFLEPDALETFRNDLNDLIQNVANQYKAEINVEFGPGYPVTLNTPALYQKHKSYLSQHGLKVEDVAPTLAAEDFSFYLQKKPGVFWLLGVEQPGSGPHHSPTFNPDTKAFHKGVALWLLLSQNV